MAGTNDNGVVVFHRARDSRVVIVLGLPLPSLRLSKVIATPVSRSESSGEADCLAEERQSLSCWL